MEYNFGFLEESEYIVRIDVKQLIDETNKSEIPTSLFYEVIQNQCFLHYSNHLFECIMKKDVDIKTKKKKKKKKNVLEVGRSA